MRNSKIADRDDEYEEDDFDDEDDDDNGYIPCPHCGETMLEAADHCPSCDRWITREDLPTARTNPWFVAVVVMVLATFLFSVLRFF